MRPIVFSALFALTCSCATTHRPGGPALASVPSLRTIDGSTTAVELDDPARPVLLVFWASWCKPCNHEAPAIVAFAQQNRGRVDVVGISVDPRRPQAAAFALKHGLVYPNLHDPDLALSDRFGVSGTPALVVLGPKGRVLARGTRLAQIYPALSQAEARSLSHKFAVYSGRAGAGLSASAAVGRRGAGCLSLVRRPAPTAPTSPPGMRRKLLGQATNFRLRARVGLTTRSTTLMGTSIELVIATPTRPSGPRMTAALNEAVAEIERIEDRFTTWRPSDLLRLSDAAGAWVAVDEEMAFVLGEAARLCELSDGGFDASYRGVAKAWNFRADQPRPPHPEAVEAALKNVGCEQLEVDRQNGLARVRKGASIGLGGLVKGYAVDRAALILRHHGFHNFVVNAGGDLAAAGRFQGRLWQVAIKHPRRTDRPLAMLPVSGYAVATSGDYERFFEHAGTRYHHILDPRTGYPANGAQSVTVLAKTTAEADALATGVFVLGPERGLALIDRLDGVEALIVDAGGQIHRSAGL